MQGGDARGLAMPEAMVAVLLFSVTAMILLNYLQQLGRTQEKLYQHQQALSYSHQALELYRLGLPVSLLELPAGWRLSAAGQPRGSGCLLINAEVITPLRHTVALGEWFCDRPALRR